MIHFQIRILIVVLFSIIFQSSGAQILNIDRIDTSAYTPKAQWIGNFTTSLEVDKQKETLVDASNFLDMQLQKNKELFILSSSYRFTYNGDEHFLNAGYVHLRWRHEYRNKFQPETFAQYQWDENRGMEHRFVGGINARYNYWHEQLWELAIGVGVMYEDEIWNYVAVDSAKIPPNPTPQTSKYVKSNSYIKWEGKTSPNSIFSVVVFYQAAFNHFFSDPRIAGLIRWDLNISKHFSFTINYSGLYDVKPVVPITRFYYSLSNGITYRIR